MSDALSSLVGFGGTARLFPLPNLVLFPAVVQPLHIFEPRYRQLLADALAGDRLMAMALLKPGWEEDYHKRPPVHPVVCLGRIFKEERLPDGRYNLLLHGLSRARVHEELPADRLYRVARVELLDDVEVASAGAERDLRKQLSEQMDAWFASQPASREQLRRLVQSVLPLGTLCDIFSFALPLDAAVKQGLLEERDVGQRVGALLAHLATASPPGSSVPPGRHFPPDFSSN